MYRQEAGSFMYWGSDLDPIQTFVRYSVLSLYFDIIRLSLLVNHRVGRVLSFFSSHRNWDSPTPLAAGECAPPPFGPGGRAHSLAAKGVG
jgi:hypothetical protein